MDFNYCLLIIAFIVIILTITSLWEIFKKAGHKSWEAIIPIYNIVVLFKISGFSPWLSLLILVPIANIYILIKLFINLAHCFGKTTDFGISTFFFAYVFLPIIAFDNSTYTPSNMNNNQQMYNNQMNNQPENNTQGLSSFCINCGQQFNDSDTFCTRCGNKR